MGITRRLAASWSIRTISSLASCHVGHTSLNLQGKSAWDSAEWLLGVLEAETRLAITGSSGYLGRLIVSALEEESQVSQILGLGVVCIPYGSRKLSHLSMDIRDPQVAEDLNENRIDTLL